MLGESGMPPASGPIHRPTIRHDFAGHLRLRSELDVATEYEKIAGDSCIDFH